MVAPTPAPTLPTAGARNRRFARGGPKHWVDRQSPGTQPRLVAAVCEVEERGGGHDRHPRGADSEAAAARSQPVRDAVGRRQAESRASRKHNRVDALDEIAGAEQIRLPARRRSAGDVHGRYGRRVRQERP